LPSSWAEVPWAARGRGEPKGAAIRSCRAQCLAYSQNRESAYLGAV